MIYLSLMDTFEFPKIQKNILKKASLFEPSDDKAYWLSRTAYERLQAVELMRKIFYGDTASSRLQRVLEVAKRT